MSGLSANENIARITGAFERLGFRTIRQAEHITMERENGDGTRTLMTIPGHALLKVSTLSMVCDKAGISQEEFTNAYNQVDVASVPAWIAQPPSTVSAASETPGQPSGLQDLAETGSGNGISAPETAEPVPAEGQALEQSAEQPLGQPVEVLVEIAADELQEPLAPTLRTFEDLTLSEMFARLIRRPFDTVSALRQTVFRPPVPPARSTAEAVATETVEPGVAAAPIVVEVGRKKRHAVPSEPFDWRALLPLLGMVAAVLIALFGSVMLTSARDEALQRALPIDGALMIGGAAIMVIIGFRSLHMARLPALVAPAKTKKAAESGLAGWLEIYGLRVALAGIGLLWVGGAWVYNVDNQFTSVGVFCWIMSIITWTVVFWDNRRNDNGPGWLARQVQRVRALFEKPISFRLSWTVIALVVILLVGGWFRFRGLGLYPPDMTSDHVEKALDAERVFEGDRSIFFPNNGGREGFQMYYLAVLKAITGMPIGLTFLQIGSGIEGIVMIILAWWMGREIIGDEDRQLGNLTGLIMAAMIAISFWHVLLSRLGLRIVTTTLDVAIVFVFLARGLRYNRRRDYLIAGLALGVGMYCYQAIRMLPLVVIVGFIFALILRVRSRRDLGRYIVNLIVLIVVALVVFIPLAHYMAQYPGEFWSRTAGRLFGEQGATSVGVALANFQKNLPGLWDNLKRSALMFNYQGDMSWFNGAVDGTPELDFFAGALFILGLGLIVYRMFRRRDPVDWLLPISIFIMLFPAALAIAFTIEVPSLTRASGALPMVYLVAALPLAVILRMVSQQLRRRRLRFAIYGVVILCLVLAANANSYTYFVTAMSHYRDSTLPHRQAGQILAGFVASTGAPGNAFVPAFPNWWDYRALAIESGDSHWANIIWRDPGPRQNVLDLINRNMDTRYEIRTDRQILIFIDPTDNEMIALANTLFPNGQTFHISAYKPERDFLIYVAPPVSCDWLNTNVGRLPETCQSPAEPDAETTPEPGADSAPTAAPQ